MRQILRVFFFVLGLLLLGVGALSFIANLLMPGESLPRTLRMLVLAAVWMGIGWTLVKQARKPIDKDAPPPDRSTLTRVHEFYVLNRLDQRPAQSLAGNIYASVSDSELDGVVQSINPNAPQHRIAALMDAVKWRIEANYLPDGRRVPEAIKRTVVQPAAPDSQCAYHSGRPATVTCARCGSFACQECAPRWGHCTPCLPKIVDAA